nr:SOS response-associated peptidase [Lachnospiraceae bacterium]
LAGIYRLYEDMEHFTIITTDANESMKRIHDRMPLMIREEDIFSWMGDSFRAVMELEMPELDIHIENEQLSFI